MLKLKTKTPFYVMAVAAFLITLGVASMKTFGPPLYLNVTPSEPRGLYRLVKHRPQAFERRMYVIFPVPIEVRNLVYGRHWLPNGAPFLKEIAALHGDSVCVTAQAVSVNDARLGPVFEVDSMGFALPKLRGCFDLRDGDFFAASRHLDRSFDGRYFGPQPVDAIVGEAIPVWTF